MDGYGGFLFLNVTALFLRDQWMKDDRFKLTRISPGKTWSPETFCRLEQILSTDVTFDPWHSKVHVEERSIYCVIVCADAGWIVEVFDK